MGNPTREEFQSELKKIENEVAPEDYEQLRRFCEFGLRALDVIEAARDYRSVWLDEKKTRVELAQEAPVWLDENTTPNPAEALGLLLKALKKFDGG